ncbi:MAG: PEP-CTERM sorting domain-containing protein [Pirellulales bacterium]|nr:PEP-CTERM sorting domain-containing protein [Pirellulales bacterium]
MKTVKTFSRMTAALATVVLVTNCTQSGRVATAATIGVGNQITAITASGTTLTSFTFSSTVYDTLSSPTSFVDNKFGTDWLHTSASAPADLTEAIGSLDLSDGSLNHSFEAQFGTLSDSALVFLLTNGNNNTQTDVATVYPIDAAGNRLGGVSGTIDFSTGAFATLVATQTYNRTTNGSPAASLGRVVIGIAFTLADLGIDGQAGTTGIEIVTSDLDPQEIGIGNAAVPEPASLALFCLAMASLACIRRRRR